MLEDSIVRGTQLKNQTVRKLWKTGAKEIHIRSACSPLLFPCKYSYSTLSTDELIAWKAIKIIKGKEDIDIINYFSETDEYKMMVEFVCQELEASTLRYHFLDDMIQAIGLPKERLCLYCWTGTT